jgi:hypothetical protein
VDHRRKADGSWNGRSSLQDQAPSESALWVSYLYDQADQRLHGTYIPASEAATQAPMPEIAPQALLQDKLHQSRLAYFFDIVFHRPTVRDKSKAEQVVLALMWPLAWVALVIAVAEVVRMSGVGSNRAFQFKGNTTN